MRFADYGKRVVFAAFDGGEITSDAGVLLLRPRTPVSCCCASGRAGYACSNAWRAVSPITGIENA